MGKRECVICGNTRDIYSKNRCYWCAIKSYSQKNEKNYGGLVNKLDGVFSDYIRLKYSDKDGFAKCFTSGKKIHWTKLHAGHFIDREHMSVRWSERNVFPQSYDENINKRGNLKIYRKRLVERFGLEWVEELEKLGRKTKVWREEELKAKIQYYSELVKLLKDGKKEI